MKLKSKPRVLHKRTSTRQRVLCLEVMSTSKNTVGKSIIAKKVESEGYNPARVREARESRKQKRN